MEIERQLREPDDPSLMAGTWWIASVWTGRERRVAESLASAGVKFYLPMTSRRRRDAAGKSRVHDLVLIPSYVFACCADSKQRYSVEDSHFVRRRETIEIRDQERLKRELHFLWVSQKMGAIAEPWGGVEIDGTYRVIRGPYQGLVGIVERVGSNHLIQLRVSEISYSHALEIEPDNIERV